jgi:hypothetical protein
MDISAGIQELEWIQQASRSDQEAFRCLVHSYKALDMEELV